MLTADPARFIRDNLNIAPVAGRPDITLYQAHSGSGLSRLHADLDEPPAPYWAHVWAGGLVLARHLAAEPAAVRGRRVLDLGAGSGLVAITAMRAGAARAIAAEIDCYGVAAIGLNAALNDVAVTAFHTDLLETDPASADAPQVDVVLVGDLFYNPDLARRATEHLLRRRRAGQLVLVGDPGRADLPHDRLHLLAEYDVPDVGGGAHRPGRVFSFG